jgi:hypothetical protein
MFRMKLILERFDRDMRLLGKKEQWSRSFVAGFIRLLYIEHAQVTFASPYSMPDITNAARNVDNQATGGYGYHYMKNTLKVGSSPGASEMFVFGGQSGTAAVNTLPNSLLNGEVIGIQVGTGVAAVTSIDYALQTRIVHGRAGGQLEYGGCELVNPVFAGANGEFTLRRYFTNLSGGGITVQEVGIYAVGSSFIGGSDWSSVWPFCIARDLTGGDLINDTEIYRVTYVPQITV